MSDEPTNYLKLAANIVGAYVSNNPVPLSDLAATIRSVHETLGSLSGAPGFDGKASQAPAVPVKASITPGYLICLEDGKKLKMLKRYIRARFGLSPDEYRRKWGLPHDYPMVAAHYSARRSVLAKQSGLGRVGKAKTKRARAKNG